MMGRITEVAKEIARMGTVGTKLLSRDKTGVIKTFFLAVYSNAGGHYCARHIKSIKRVFLN
jgi:hypothetical protein